MIFVVISMAFFFIQNVANKEYGVRYSTDMKNLMLFQLIAHAGMAAVLFFLELPTLPTDIAAFSTSGVLFAILYGITYLIAISCLTKAFSIGPMGITTLIINLSLVLAVTVSAIFFGEKITLNRALGFPCVLTTLVLSATGGKGGQKANPMWLLLTLIVFFTDGGLSIIQKTFLHVNPDASTNLFLLISVIAGFAISGVMCVVNDVKDGGLPANQKPWLFSGFALAVGISTALATSFSMRALTVIDAVIVFPVRQGGLILVIALYGILRYKDKIDLKTVIMFLSGIMGIVLFNP